MTSRRPALPRSAVLAFATALLAFLVLAAPSLSAQVVFGGAQRTLPAGTLNAPQGVAVDAAGDVFILSIGSKTLVKLAPDGTVTTLASGLSAPPAVATDPSGNVYYDDAGTNKITEITTAGVSSTVASGISAPSGLAVDSVGNVYVGTSNGFSATIILKIAPGGAQSTVNTYTLAASSVGLYVDSDGNLFIADAGNSRILEVSSAGVTTQVAASGLSVPFGVATDAAGNVFIADSNNNRVVEVPAGGGAQRTLGTGLSYPLGIAADASGNVYVAADISNRVVEIQPSALNFGSANLSGGASVTWSLIYNFSGSETLTGASVVTQGATGLDFAPVASGTTCAAGTFGTGTNQCLLNVNFTPVAPGTRLGAATLSTSSGTLITTFLAGTGTGPQIGFGPGTPSVATIAGAGNPLGAAVDASGNLYIADNSADKVFKIAPGGTQTTVGSGFSGPTGVAVDGAGNIYVADNGAAAVYKIPADGTAQTTVGTGFEGPLDVAVDTVGNIFVADAANDVVKITADGSTQSTVVSSSTLIAGTALNGLWGLAVDAADNVYIADGNNARVVKVPGNGGSPTVILAGLEQPWAVALDAAGDLYVSDTDHNQILELPAGSSSPVTLVSSSATFGSPAESLLVPSGLALDASGNIYLVDNGNERVVTLNRAAVPSLAAAFASTVYGDTSAAQTVTVNNTGNTGLAFSALSIATGFLQQSSGGTDCSATAIVLAGANCILQLAFQPTSAAAFSGSAILTDNVGNVAGTLQTIALGGTGDAATITPSLIGTVSKTYDTTTTATLAAANYTFTGTVGSDDVAITTPAGGTYDTASVGTNKTVVVTGVALTGTAAANYQLSSTSVSGAVGSITAATITPGLTGTVSKTYDTTTAATLVAGNYTFTGKLGSDSVAITTPASGTYNTASVGTGKTVAVAGVALTGTAAGNYQLSTTNVSGAVGSITAATITPGLTGTVSKTYDTTTAATLAAANYTFTGKLGSDSVAITTPASGTYDTASVGTNKTVAVTGVALSGTAAGNYQLSTTNVSGAVGSITAATITPGLTGTVSKTYDTTTTATLAAGNYAFTGKLGSDSVAITTPATGAYATAGVGSNIAVAVTGVALTGSAAANYQLSTTAVAGPVGVITPAALAVSANAAGMTYGGTLPAFTGTVTGALTGDSFTESFTTTATTSSPAGAYSIVPAVAGAHLADYTVTPTPGTLTVAKAPLAVTAAAASIAYGSVPPAFTAQYSGFVNGDSAATALSGAPSLSTAATSASPVGTYPIVVAAGTLGAANYTFAFTNAALTVTAASQAISFAAIPSQSNYTTPLTLAATASSGLPVAFSVVSGPATVSGSILTLTGEGTVVVEADQAGNGNYLAAPPVRQTVAVGGPEAILTPASLGFGNQVIGAASTAQALTLQNPGSAPLAIASIAASGDFAQTNNCSATLAAGASCSILVVFTPSALGSRGGAVAVSDNAPSPLQSAALAGTGVDFNLSLASGASTNNTIDAGGTATYSLNLASDAFTGTVALACAGAPANATCTVTPASSALSPGAATAVTVSVVTTARSIVPPVPGSRPPSWPWLLLLTLPALGWLWRRRQRGHRRALPAWLLGAVAGAALLAAGCGGVSNLPGAGTAAGTYTITVTATAGAAARSVSLGLAVN